MHERATVVALSERAHLERLAASRKADISRRARILLLINEGCTDAQVAARLGISRKTVWRWRTRFAAGGIAVIEVEKPRTGRKPRLRDRVARVIIETTLTVPPENAPTWSTRRLARHLGVSRGMVHRVWRIHGVVPPVYMPAPK
jgi:transposase